MSSFRTETFGKWILAGEHAVLRGCPAMAFPLVSRSFRFEHQDSEQDLKVTFTGERGEDYRLLFYGVLEQALTALKVSRETIGGVVTIDSSLPVGSGLGASAALCVALGRWFSYLKLISEEEIHEFSRGLEDLFHGESSGVDIAVALKAHGIHFVRGKQMKDLVVGWKPNIYLSYSGTKGLTAECVNKVKSLFDSKPHLAHQLDRQMSEAVEMAETALHNQEPSSQQLRDLKTAILLARDCFEKWGLIFGDLEDHMRSLDEAGALAVKPTGSGGGGYVLSLWDPEDQTPGKLGLIPAF